MLVIMGFIGFLELQKSFKSCLLGSSRNAEVLLWLGFGAKLLNFKGGKVAFIVSNV